MQESLQYFHVSGRNLFDNSGSHHAEVGQITCCPQENGLKALQYQQHLSHNVKNMFKDMVICVHQHDM